MRILLLNQAFYPDVVATAQQAADLAVELTSAGHDVTVVASRRAYDDPATTFASSENWRGVRIERIWSSGLGKRSHARRLVDFVTFVLSCAFKLLFSRSYDVVVALTSPPLIAFLAALFVRARGGRLCYWVMDLNPDQAIAAGILPERDPRTAVLEAMLRFTLETAGRIIVLDRFMQQRICRRGIDPGKVVTQPPWSQDGVVSFNETGRAEFRRMHGLTNKFVVMYSGNHSPCHPLESVLRASEELAGEDDVVFCFVGGGIEHRRIRRYAEARCRGNILCLPYQPLEMLSNSLSAADLHVVVMGNEYVGMVHPSKLYNVLTLGIPLLYVGPVPSHVTDLAPRSCDNWLYSARHGDVASIVRHVRRAKSKREIRICEEQSKGAEFSQHRLASNLRREIEALATPEAVTSAPERVEAAPTK